MAKVEVQMPKMGESITEGTVIAWHKQVGDSVKLDETLLEIGTDKVDTDVPAVASGIVAEILASEGDTVPVGQVVAVIVTEEAEKASVIPAPEQSKPESPPKSTEGEQSDVQVVMPKMGESITEGTVITWHKQVGDSVELDETLLEIGTDKVDTDVPSPAGGVVKEILVEEGETVPVGTPIAVVGPTVGAPAVSQPVTPPPPPPIPAPTPTPPPAPTTEVAQPPTVPVTKSEPEKLGRHLDDGRFLSPLVRSIAMAEGVGKSELRQVQGSGREGRITKKDLLSYLATRSEAASPPVTPLAAAPSAEDGGDRIEIIEMDRMRQLIAEHMTHSRRTSAHVTSFAEVDASNLVRIRDINKKVFQERDGIKLTYTPFLVHAAVEALREYPMLNASVEGNRILLRKDYHIGIAVAIENTGLIVPVIKHAGRHSIAGLAHAAHDLAHRARTMDLQPDDLQGGTFTLTNVGSLGSLMGTPIILQPQVAILATGAICKRPVVVEDANGGDMIAVRHMMMLSLSYDHRIIDGAMGIAFLRRFSEVLEQFNPAMEV